MKLGEVIREHRKMKKMTQEEMAACLGVTAPAVNKWENGNTMPDITLLAPIARLLEVSLNELLSFGEELSNQEIGQLTEEAARKFLTEDYEAVFAWAKEKIETYPNCETLIHSLAMMLDANRVVQQITDADRYDPFILNCYQRILKSSDEAMRTAAADALYHYYLRREQYNKAGEYLSYFSLENPERKRKQAVLYEKTGDTQLAYKTYEEILFSGYQVLSTVLIHLFHMAQREENRDKIRYYTEKRKELARLFEMGAYHAYAADMEQAQAEKDPHRTLICAQGMLDQLDTVYGFSGAPLYFHMDFKSADPGFVESLRKNMVEGFRSEPDFAYMEKDPRWVKFLNGK